MNFKKIGILIIYCMPVLTIYKLYHTSFVQISDSTLKIWKSIIDTCVRINMNLQNSTYIRIYTLFDNLVIAFVF